MIRPMKLEDWGLRGRTGVWPSYRRSDGMGGISFIHVFNFFHITITHMHPLRGVDVPFGDMTFDLHSDLGLFLSAKKLCLF